MQATIGDQCRTLRIVKIPMRDGVELYTSIYLPLSDEPCPAVLVRTAYNRTGMYDAFFPTRGMAMVVQDCRGRYDSGGDHVPFADEEKDGYDTIEWIGKQPWCNGKIGMFGDSYLAATQFAAALADSPGLAALTPRFMSGDCWKRAYYCDGVLSLALTWSWLCFEETSRTSDSATMPLLDVPKVLRHLPICELDEAAGAGVVPAYRQYVTRGQYDDHWKSLSIRDHYHEFTMPTLWVGGWYDNYALETATNFLGCRDNATTPEQRDSHRMLIGPWPHGVIGSSELGDLDFGPDALTENDATHRWLDCILHDRPPAEYQPAPIRLFVMGINKWRDEYEWPLARTRYVNYYLHEQGQLDTSPSAENAATDTYDYDPANPAPTVGGNHSVGAYNPGLYEHAMPGPFDQRTLEQRDDVLVYTSDVLEKDTEVTGHVTLTLYASTSALDTDFVAKLTDVYPDGRSINITEGVIRARFRDDVYGKPKLLEPDHVYKFSIDMQITSNVFKAGHRLRLLITSSNFPLWDRNLNTGNDPATDTQMVVARQTIHHRADKLSHIVLPMIDG